MEGGAGSPGLCGFVTGGCVAEQETLPHPSAGGWAPGWESCDQDPKVEKFCWQKPRTSAQTPTISIGSDGERLCDRGNSAFLVYEHLIYKNIDSTSLDVID